MVVVDAVIVLCGGVLTGKTRIHPASKQSNKSNCLGIMASCELFEQLARDRALPATFLKVLPTTRAPYVSIFSFTALCAMVYASADGRLDVVSLMWVKSPDIFKSVTDTI